MSLTPADLIQPKGELEPDLFAGGRNAVQTLTASGSPSAGSYSVAGANPDTLVAFSVSSIPYNVSFSALQSLFDAAIGAGNSLVTGGPHPTTPLRVEFRQDYGERVVSLMAVNNAGLTGGTVAAASTVDGASETYLRAEEYLDQASDETDIEDAQAAFVYWRAFSAKARQMRADAMSSQVADGSKLQYAKEQIAGFEAEAAQWKAAFDALVADDAGDIPDDMPTTRAVRVETVW